jgi:arginine/lysine/ornithine decarboxylase
MDHSRAPVLEALQEFRRRGDVVFGRVEQVPAKAAGRVAAEVLSPYPPGVPVLAPGERISQEALDYLTSGVAAGMIVPDAADPTLETVRVVRE